MNGNFKGVHTNIYLKVSSQTYHLEVEDLSIFVLLNNIGECDVNNVSLAALKFLDDKFFLFNSKKVYDIRCYRDGSSDKRYSVNIKLEK